MTRSIRAFYCLCVFVYISVNQIYAQMPIRNFTQVAILGWVDDTHYLISNYDDSKKLVTMSVDIKSGKSIIYTPPKSGREQLIGSLPAGTEFGINDFVSSDMKSAVIIRDNDLFYFLTGEKELRRLTNDKSPEVNGRFSPDGKKIAYTKNKDLYVFDLIGNKEKRLTYDASEKIYNGYSSWVYMEEILTRASKYAAFWWSPDGGKIAYLRTDETDVPVFTLNRLDEPDGIHGTLEVVPYPKPGDPNPKVKIGIADIFSGKTTWVKTDYSVDQYIAWPFWTPDSKKLAIQVVNRDQNELQIILADSETGDYKRIYDENNKTWVEFREDIYVLNNGTGFIIRSYKSGWENLYYYGWDGKLNTQLTNLNFRVNSIDSVDENHNVVYFSATGSESTDNHAYRVGLDGKNLLQITKGNGSHNISISPKGSYYIDTWNSVTSPGSIVAYDKKGRRIKEIYTFKPLDFDPVKHTKTELFKIPTADGFFNLPAIITYPPDFNPSKKYPVVFDVYGGPDSKSVLNKWQEYNASWFSRNGIIRLTVDHRGSGHFGKKGLDYMYRCLGKWELLDYEDAVKWLLEKPFVDSTKIGIMGTSYGGYLTCLAMTKGADYWTHGIAGMAVTDFRLYDNIYTERFMDLPMDNPEGYKDGSALTYAKNLRGKLYIYHADMDDNVHFQNSIYLISKLQDEDKTFRFMLYPNGRHGWGGLKALHVRNETNNFWLENFFGK